MTVGQTMKVVKEIRVDIDLCTGCRACEMACSAYHAKPRYSAINPAKSRIRVVSDEINDEYVPIRAGDYTPSECNGRHIYAINGKEYSFATYTEMAESKHFAKAMDIFRIIVSREEFNVAENFLAEKIAEEMELAEHATT